MIVIEVDGQRVECEDEKQAQKCLRKATKAARARAAAAAADAEMATLRANAEIARLVESACAILDENSGRYFRVHSDDDTFRQYIRPDGGTRYKIHAITNTGCAVYESWGVRITAVLETGSGFLRAVQYGGEGSVRPYWCAVGVCGDQCAVVAVPDRISAMVDEAAARYAEKKAERAAAEAVPA